MKKILTMMLVALLPIMAFNSCSDDDDKTLSDVVAGTYKVDVSTSISEGTIPASIEINRAADTKVNISLKGFKLTPAAEPVDVNISGVALSGKSGNVIVTYNGPIVTQPALGTLTGTIAGTIKGKTIDLVINISGIPGMSTLTVTVKNLKN